MGIIYKDSGVNYESLDAVKRMAQLAGRRTFEGSNLQKMGGEAMGEGESAAIIVIPAPKTKVTVHLPWTHYQEEFLGKHIEEIMDGNLTQEQMGNLLSLFKTMTQAYKEVLQESIDKIII